jgi:hypothetical protein
MSNRVEIKSEREQTAPERRHPTPEWRDSHIAKVAMRILGYPGKLSSIAT